MTLSTEYKKNQNRTQYLQIIYLLRDSYPEYIQNTYNSTSRKANNLVKKWTKDLNRHFSIRDTQRGHNT